MRCSLRGIALGLLAAAIATPTCAETTPAPPVWADAGGSVYLTANRQEPSSENSTPAPAPQSDAHDPSAAPPLQPPPIHDFNVAPATHETSAPADRDAKYLAPPNSSLSSTAANNDDRSGTLRPVAASGRIDFGLPKSSIYTIASALAIVIGAFLLFAWALRRGTKRTNNALPADVVSVLGRVPLAARQFAELLRVGNKLVLVSLTPTGAETITEVTDPAEVDRLVGLCQQYSPHSTTNAFEQVFRQLSRETAPGGFLGGEPLPSFASPAAAYRAHGGHTARG